MIGLQIAASVKDANEAYLSLREWESSISVYLQFTFTLLRIRRPSGFLFCQHLTPYLHLHTCERTRQLAFSLPLLPPSPRPHSCSRNICPWWMYNTTHYVCVALLITTVLIHSSGPELLLTLWINCRDELCHGHAGACSDLMTAALLIALKPITVQGNWGWLLWGQLCPLTHPVPFILLWWRMRCHYLVWSNTVWS